MTWIGIGHRQELVPWIDACPEEIDCLEIIAEHFITPKSRERLRTLATKYPLMIHSLGMSLGSPGPLDASRLARLAEIVTDTDPVWVSEHVGFCRTEEVDLGHFNPVRPVPASVSVMADHAREMAEACGRPVILENITTSLRIKGSLSETEFLNRLSEESGCGLLFDVTNLFINSRNHGFDPYSWLRDIDPRRIVQLHVVGYSYVDGRWYDTHEEAIQDDLWKLVLDVLAYAPVQAVILERDGNFPPVEALELEMRRLKKAARDVQRPAAMQAVESVALN